MSIRSSSAVSAERVAPGVGLATVSAPTSQIDESVGKRPAAVLEDHDLSDRLSREVGDRHVLVGVDRR